jgi:hypothetical protein
MAAKDVAKRAKVAIGTVSRVLNHYPDVILILEVRKKNEITSFRAELLDALQDCRMKRVQEGAVPYYRMNEITGEASRTKLRAVRSADNSAFGLRVPPVFVTGN